MAFDSNYVFRVIVEGDDFLSNLIGNAAKNYSRDTNKIRNSTKALRAELVAAQNDVTSFARAIESKATTARGFAKILGISEREVAERDLTNRILKYRRVLRGEITRDKIGDFSFAQFLGIQEIELDEWEKAFGQIFELRDKFRQGAATGNVQSAFRTLFGIPDREFNKVQSQVRSLSEEFDDVAKKAANFANQEKKFQFMANITDLASKRLALIRDQEAIKRAFREAAGPRPGQLALPAAGESTPSNLGQKQFQALEKELTDVNRELDLLTRRLAFFRARYEANRVARRDTDITPFQAADLNTRKKQLEEVKADRDRLAAELSAARRLPDFVAGTSGVESRKDTRVDRQTERYQKIIKFQGEFNDAMRKAAPTIDFVNERLALLGDTTEVTSRKFARLRMSFGNFFTGLTKSGKFEQLQKDFDSLNTEIGTLDRKLKRARDRYEIERKSRGLEKLSPGRQADLNAREAFRDSRVREKDRLEKELQSASNVFFRAGAAVRRFINDADTLVRVRWLLLVTFITLLVKTLITLGAALVEVGSSAIAAGAALGGAFAAGVLQAVAVIGLLQVAMSRLSKVFDLAAQQEKLNIRSSTDMEAQAKAEKDAQDALRDAIERRSDAIVDLARARRQAARDLVDAAFEERDANLSLQEAELGVIEARERLAELQAKQNEDGASTDFLRSQITEAQARLQLAQSLGQEAEISAASQQLSIAQSNYNAFLDQADTSATDIAAAQLDVQRADLTLDQAHVRAKRARQDNAEAKRKGIKGDDQVVQALRSVRDATQGVVKAQEALTEATNKQTAAQKQLEDELADLTTAERGLFNTVVSIREKFKTVFRPITDIIVSAVDRGIKKASTLLDDPKLISAARGLALELSRSIDRISSFAVSPAVKESLGFFIREARSNLPLITTAFINLAKAFLRIAEAGAPIFKNLVERFTGLTGKIEKLTANRERLDNFFAIAAHHLDSWIKLGKAIISALYQIGRAAAPSGETLIDNLTNALERLSVFLERNQTAARKFFEEQRVNIEEFVGVLFTLGIALFEAFNNSDLEKFVQLIADVLIPSFQLALYLLDSISAAILAISKIPMATEILQLLFAIGILRRFFPVIKNLDKVLLSVFTGKRSRDAFKKFGEEIIRTVNKHIGPAFGGIATRIDKVVRPALARLAISIRAVTTAMLGANAAALLNPYVLIAVAIIALIATLVALELKFHILSKIGDGFRSLADFFTNHWKTVVLAAITAPFGGLAIVPIIRWRKELKGSAEEVLNFFRRNWITLASLILGPFSALRLLIIRRWGKDVANVASDVIDAFRRIPSEIGTIFDGMFSGRYIAIAYQFGRDLVQGIIDGVISKAADLKDWFFNVIDSAIDFVKDALAIDSPSGYTRDNIGIPIGEGIREGAKQGISGLGSELATALRVELSGVEGEINKTITRLTGSLGQFQSYVNQALELKLGEQTPAEKELAKLTAQEAKRDRTQRVQASAGSVKTAKQEVSKANKEVIAAKKLLTKATTEEEKNRAKAELATAKQAQKTAIENLNSANKQHREVLHDAWVEERRERLTQQAITERRAIEQSVAAEQKRADKLFNALKTALNDQNWEAIQDIFRKIVNLTSLEALGEVGAEAFLKGFERKINKGVSDATKAAEIKAQQNKAASKVLSASPRIQNEAAVIRTEKGTEPADILKSFIESGTLDKKTAIAIVRNLLSVGQADRMIRLLTSKEHMPGDDYIAVRDAINEYKKKSKTITSKQQLIKLLNDGKLNYGAAIATEEEFFESFVRGLQKMKLYQEGGLVTGGEGQAVPIIAHAGEWVLNKKQQNKLSARMGTSVESTKKFLFGDRKSSGMHFARGGEVPGFGVAPSFGGDPRLDIQPLWEWEPGKRSWDKGVTLAEMAKKLGQRIPWSKGWKMVDKAARFASKLNMIDPVPKLPSILGKILGGDNTYDVAKTQITDLFSMVKGARAGNRLDQAFLSLMFLPGILRTKRVVQQAVKQGAKMGILGIGEEPAFWKILIGGAGNTSLSRETAMRYEEWIAMNWITKGPIRGDISKGYEKESRINEAAGMADHILGERRWFDRVIIALNKDRNPVGLGAINFGSSNNDYDHVPYAAAMGGNGLHVFRKILEIAKERGKGLDFDGTGDASKLYRGLGITEHGERQFRIEPDEVRELLRDSRALIRKKREEIAFITNRLRSGKIQLNANASAEQDYWRVLLKSVEEKTGDTFSWHNLYEDAYANARRRLRMRGGNGPVITGATVLDVTNKDIFNQLVTDFAWRDRSRSTRIPGQHYEDFAEFSKDSIRNQAKWFREFFKNEGYKLTGRYYQKGGEVQGQGSAVPAIVHVGEWVLNKAQQSKLAKKLNMGASDLKTFLFGNRMDAEQYQSATKGMKRGESKKYDTFSLAKATDDYGAEVWFIEFDDGYYGQIREEDAQRIIKTGGQWVPGWVKRSGHGFTASYLDFASIIKPLSAEDRKKLKKGGGSGGAVSLARGGEILANFAVQGFNPAFSSNIQSYAEGGVVTASPSSVSNGDTVNKTINQNFNVKTEGETDWNYVLRLGAIHAVG